MTQSRLVFLGALCALALPAQAQPTLPTPVFPLLGQTMDAGEETLAWTGSESPDGPLLNYDVEIRTPTGVTLITSGIVVANGEGADETWLITAPLEEDTMYSWQVRARNLAGETSEFTERVLFGYKTDNEEPSAPVFITPLLDDDLATTQPVFRLTSSEDPEGGPVTHTLELDSSPSFNTADLLVFEPQASAKDEVSVDLKGTADFLAEDRVWHARATAVDAEGLSSEPEIISFFVRGDNAAPAVPELIRPQPNEVTTAHPTLVVGNVSDPEGDVVTYEFAVGPTRDLSGVAAVNSATREFEVTTELAGGYYWTVRARDEVGGRSDWAEPRYAVAADPAWGCAVSGDRMPSWWWLVCLVSLGLIRRRERQEGSARCLD